MAQHERLPEWLAQSEATYRDLLQRAEENLELFHHHTGQACFHLARLQHEQRYFDEAAQTYQRAWDVLAGNAESCARLSGTVAPDNSSGLGEARRQLPVSGLVVRPEQEASDSWAACLIHRWAPEPPGYGQMTTQPGVEAEAVRTRGDFR